MTDLTEKDRALLERIGVGLYLNDNIHVGFEEALAMALEAAREEGRQEVIALVPEMARGADLDAFAARRSGPMETDAELRARILSTPPTSSNPPQRVVIEESQLGGLPWAVIIWRGAQRTLWDRYEHQADAEAGAKQAAAELGFSGRVTY